jgi:uncharacterized membrane protein YphA (DoxX/SURF4 family)
MPRYTFFTILFLILLRLAIGWHFLYEGWHKLHSWMVGPSETNRPFTSEGFFREATGPVAPVVRSEWFLGDPDDRALALLTPTPAPEDPEKTSPGERVPPALAQQWDDYTNRFIRHFKLDERQQQDAQVRLAQTKSLAGMWLTLGESPLPEQLDGLVFPAPAVKEIQKNYPTGVFSEDQTVPRRVADYRDRLGEMRLLRDRKSWAMGKVVDRAPLAAAKADVAAMRKDLLDDLEKFTTALKVSLGVILKSRVEDVPLLAEGDRDEATLKLLTEKGLNEKWDEIAEQMAAAYQVSITPDNKAGKALEQAKRKAAAWLADRDQQSIKAATTTFGFGASPDAGPLLAVSALASPSLLGVPRRVELYQEELKQRGAKGSPAIDEAGQATAGLRRSLQDDLKARTAAMKDGVGREALDADLARGYAPPPPKGWWWTPIGWIDVATMLLLLVTGGCLMLGLFTRTSCVLAALFLVVTYLLYPPFPWLPAPPNTEGNYLFVSKNLIELLALLCLATTRSGRWFGVDALLHWMFRRRAPKPAPKKSDPGSGPNGPRRRGPAPVSQPAEKPAAKVGAK